MTCGLATLSVLEDEGLIENSEKMGRLLLDRLDALRAKHPLIKEVRGKGLMISIEFHEPPQLGLKLAWRLLHRIDTGLFAQLVVVPLLSRHRILTQVAGHNMDVIKILPPLIIGEKEVDNFVKAFDQALEGCRKFPGPILELARNTARQKKLSRNSNNGAPHSEPRRTARLVDRRSRKATTQLGQG